MSANSQIRLDHTAHTLNFVFVMLLKPGDQQAAGKGKDKSSTISGSTIPALSIPDLHDHWSVFGLELSSGKLLRRIGKIVLLEQ